MKRIFVSLGLAFACLAVDALADLPPPETSSAAARPAVKGRKQAASPKRKIVKNRPSQKAQSPEEWCDKEGGKLNEAGECVRDLTEEECANLGGILENGECTADPVACELKNGSFNDSGECVFK